ncbi:CGNR zinc finger domain-containing protein [Actinomadura viridis]|uniref:CGNR zinc finger domain-containing protein n=1 Tax=Actinomadura viridis TaxID=58110 RepID=UPI00369ECE07
MRDLVPLTGEPLALDLVNTAPATGDLLATPDQLRAWLKLQAGRFTVARELLTVELTAADLAAVRDLREHIAGAVDHARHGTRPPAAALEALNRAQRAAPAVSELAWNGEAVTVTRRRTGPPGARLAAWLAEAAAELLADPAVAKVRRCEAADCVLLFLPAHPRRRWCSTARCGNRVRVARHYQRHKPA